jgi:hypothetical protein
VKLPRIDPTERYVTIRFCGECVHPMENPQPITTRQLTFTCERKGCNNKAVCTVLKKGVIPM